MSGLYYEVLYAVCCCSVEGFADVVDLLAVTSVYVVDYDIGGEASSYGVIRERSLEIVLNGADGQAAAGVEAGAARYRRCRPGFSDYRGKRRRCCSPRRPLPLRSQRLCQLQR